MFRRYLVAFSLLFIFWTGVLIAVGYYGKDMVIGEAVRGGIGAGFVLALLIAFTFLDD